MAEEKDTIKKHHKPYMAKKAIDSGTQGRKNKVLKRPIDYLTSINKGPIVDSGQKSAHHLEVILFHSFPLMQKQCSRILKAGPVL